MIRHRRIATVLSVLLASACAGPMASQRAASPVTVGILGINDFHGALEPPKLAVSALDGAGGTVAVPAGGAAWLASAIDSLRARYAHSVTVSAGDLIGASQFASSLHLDEPTIGVMNRIGLAFNAVGNHEFDKGRAELLRMQNGGCARHTARAPCQLEPFAGADFRFLAASTFTEDGKTLFPASGIKTFGSGRARVSVGFVGLTLRQTPDLVVPAGIAGLSFGDEADAINEATDALKRQGADAVVVLIHQGGRTSIERPDPNGCEAMTGAILPIMARLDPRVDVVVSGHTHWAYVCDYGRTDPSRPILLTSAGVQGGIVTDITLRIDPARNRVVDKRARNVIVQSDAFTSARGAAPNIDALPRFAPQAEIAAYVGRYVDAARALAQRPAGQLAGPATKPGGAGSGLGGPLGNLIADAQLSATASAGAQIAFMNPTGIRAALIPRADGSLTFGEIFAAQPFGNVLITQTMTGAEIAAALEQCLDGQGTDQLLSPSAGFAYWIDPAAPVGERVRRIELNGRPIDPAARYRVTTNSFLGSGGDGFSAFAGQREAVTGMTDIEALEAWLKGSAPRALPQEDRAHRAP